MARLSVGLELWRKRSPPHSPFVGVRQCSIKLYKTADFQRVLMYGGFVFERRRSTVSAAFSLIEAFIESGWSDDWRERSTNCLPALFAASPRLASTLTAGVCFFRSPSGRTVRRGALGSSAFGRP